MRSLLIVLSVVGVAIARPGYLGLGLGATNLLHAPLAYSSVAAPLAYSSYAEPVAHTISSQYHAQDEIGQYSYGYSGGPSAKNEVKTFDGVTRGGYSYVDAEGKVQNVNYVADPVNGFRVAATNLPVAPEPIPAEPLVAPEPVQDTVEVAAAKEAHQVAFAEAKAAAEAAPDVPVAEEPEIVEPAVAAVAPADLPASVLSTNVGAVVSRAYAPALSYGAISHAPISYSAPAPIAYHAPVSKFAYSSVAPALSYAHHPISYSSVAPAVAPAHIAYAAPHAVSSQYHAQDEIGQYSYGYSGGPSAKNEVKTFDGVTRGGYSYVDAEGKVQNVNYVADPVNGFRVAATNLPVAPEPIPAEPLVAPEPVQDTVEVAAAKEAHQVAFAEAKAAAEAAPDVPVAEEPEIVEPAVAAVAPADLLPASVLSRNVGAVVSHAYTPALSYGAISHAPISYSAPAPIAYHAPVSNFAYSSVAPALSYAHHAISYSAVAPAVTPAHIAYAAPHAVSSQYHAQDELGQYSYGYSGGPSAKSEVKTFDGVTRGGYSYVDAEGQVQSVNYVADALNGFRVAATNLPVAPVAPEAPLLETVHETDEVAALRADHLAAVNEAKARLSA